jgi:glycosyltransferase involved in cell wall biosynthesis
MDNKNPSKPAQPRVAILSSGLGHVSRGIETWAATLAAELHQRGLDITLFKGGGRAELPYERVVRCSQRDSWLTRTVVRYRPICCWRLGMYTPYEFEQTTFGLSILPRLICGGFDVVHLQDPQLAYILEKTRSLHRAKVILGHGTEELSSFLRQFSHIQELSPFYLNRHGDLANKKWFAIPNFVDSNRFSPGDRQAARRELGIPEDRYVVFSPAALNRSKKRLDWLAQEFQRAQLSNGLLVIAGAREPETDSLLTELRSRLNEDQLMVLENVPRDRMPLLYQAADLLTLCSLQEVQAISLLEGMACGLPCITHPWGSCTWTVGDGGSFVDMEVEGALGRELQLYQSVELRRERGQLARQRVEAVFSRAAVVNQILEMYSSVLDLPVPQANREPRAAF